MSEVAIKTDFEPYMPVVPTGWLARPFKSAVKVLSDQGMRVKKREYLEAGKIAVIDQGQSQIGGYTNNDEMAFEGELPVILFGDHTRAIKFVNEPFAVGADGVKILQPASDYDLKYFYYLLCSLQIPSEATVAIYSF